MPEEVPDFGCPSAGHAHEIMLSGSEPAPFVYLLMQFGFDPHVEHLLHESMGLSALRLAMWRRGAARVFSARTMTGHPGVLTTLWRVRVPFDLPGMHVALASDPEYAQFAEHVIDLEIDVLHPAPHDPALERPGLIDTPGTPPPKEDKARPKPRQVILIDRVTPVRGHLARLVCLKSRYFVQTVERAASWELLVAGVTLTGRPGRLVQCWRLPEASSLYEAMSHVDHSEIYRQHVAPCIEREDQHFYDAHIID